MTSFLARLFDLQRRERNVRQCEQRIAESIAILKSEWARFNMCNDRLTQLLDGVEADELRRRCEFTDTDAIIALGFGVKL